MTTEACVTKLAYLFGRLGDAERVKQIWDTDIRGEVTINGKNGNSYLKRQQNHEALIHIEKVKSAKAITSRL